ncbi:MAG: hypothetical protein ACTSXQ_04330 [Alphaproteobacteria bacterium]
MVLKTLKNILFGKKKGSVETGINPLENAKDPKDLTWLDLKGLSEIEKVELDLAAKRLAKENRDKFEKGGRTWEELKDKDKCVTGEEVKKGVKNNLIKQEKLKKHLKNKKLLKKLKKTLNKLKDALGKKQDDANKKGKKKKKEKAPKKKKLSKKKDLKLSDKTPSADKVARKTAEKAKSKIAQNNPVKGAGTIDGQGTNFTLQNEKGGGKMTFAASAQKSSFSSGRALNRASQFNNKIRNLDKKRGSLLKKQAKLDKKKKKNTLKNAPKKQPKINNIDEGSTGLIKMFSGPTGLAKMLGGKNQQNRKNRLADIQSSIEKQGAVAKKGTPSKRRGKLSPKEKSLAKKMKKINDATFLALGKKSDALENLNLSQEKSSFSGSVKLVSRDKNTPNNMRIRDDGDKQRFDPNRQLADLNQPTNLKNMGFIDEFNGKNFVPPKDMASSGASSASGESVKTTLDPNLMQSHLSNIGLS